MRTRRKQWIAATIVFAVFMAITLAVAARCVQMRAINPEECIGARWGVLMLGLPSSLASAASGGVGPIAIAFTGLFAALQWGLVAFWVTGRFARMRSS